MDHTDLVASLPAYISQWNEIIWIIWFTCIINPILFVYVLKQLRMNCTFSLKFIRYSNDYNLLSLIVVHHSSWQLRSFHSKNENKAVSPNFLSSLFILNFKHAGFPIKDAPFKKNPKLFSEYVNDRKTNLKYFLY